MSRRRWMGLDLGMFVYSASGMPPGISYDTSIESHLNDLWLTDHAYVVAIEQQF